MHALRVTIIIVIVIAVAVVVVSRQLGHHLHTTHNARRRRRCSVRRSLCVMTVALQHTNSHGGHASALKRRHVYCICIGNARVRCVAGHLHIYTYARKSAYISRPRFWLHINHGRCAATTTARTAHGDVFCSRSRECAVYVPHAHYTLQTHTCFSFAVSLAKRDAAVAGYNGDGFVLCFFF